MAERTRVGPVRTFPVDEVEPATEPLEEISYSEALQGLLSASRLAKENDSRALEAWSLRSDRLVAEVGYHPFAAALHFAYAGHRPITLSPDVIWLLICQGVAHHIHANAEQLRSRFVQHPGKLTLEVEFDEVGRFRKGSPDNPWPEALTGFSEQIRRHVGTAHSLFIPEFSTTGPIERAAAELVLMDSMRKYFNYRMQTVICGIPSITLEGTLEDWQAVLARVEGFADLDLEWWLGPLRPVLKQFIDAAGGHSDRSFWQAIYRIHPAGEPCLTPESAMGWFGLLFPYLTGRQGSTSRRNPWLSGELELDELLNGPKPTPPSRSGENVVPAFGPRFLHEGEFPSGLSRAPFVWDERTPSGGLGSRWQMELLAGFVGISQDPKSFSLRPEIGWAVREHNDAR